MNKVFMAALVVLGLLAFASSALAANTPIVVIDERCN